MLDLLKFTPEVECRALATAPDKCLFIQQTPDCQNAEGLINYLSLLYCNSYADLFTGGILMLSVWILFLFSGLATAANSFFCPALQVMAEKMKMSHNVAGVTLLALGNGAPDIFSSLAGIRQGRAELAFGELFGAGIFCTTVIAGSISFIRPFHVMERPFLRDCIFYLAAAYFVFWVFYHHYVNFAHAIGFIALYAFYVLVVIGGRLLNSRLNRRSGSIQTQITTDGDLPTDEVDADRVLVGRMEEPLEAGSSGIESIGEPESSASQSSEVVLITDDAVHVVQPTSVWTATKEEFSDLANSLKPFTVDEWTSMRWFTKVISIAEAPFYCLLRLTIPLVSDESPRQGWCRPLACLQLCLTPTWITWAVGYGSVKILNFLPLPLLVFLVGVSIALLIALFTERKREPKGHWLFAFVAFGVAVIWIDFIANEIMAVLFTFGVVFQLSDAILGLTILAWGNSVGDFAADVGMARQNAPRMGFSACFGAPLLNTLLGLGISFSIVCSEIGQNIPVTFNHLNLVMTVSLGVSLVTVLVYLPLNGFQAGKCLGIILFAVYASFIVTAILVEAGVLWPEL